MISPSSRDLGAAARGGHNRTEDGTLAGAATEAGGVLDGVRGSQGARNRDDDAAAAGGTIYPRAVRIAGIRVYREADVERLRRRDKVPSTAAARK